MRELTSEERIEICLMMSKDTGKEFADVMDKLKNGVSVCFDPYISDHPGFYGKVVVIIWPEGVELQTTLVFDVKTQEWKKVEAELSIFTMGQRLKKLGYRVESAFLPPPSTDRRDDMQGN